MPDPDLIIRTSGEVRLSGFMLWQSVHRELYFCDVIWPAMRRIDYLRAIRSFQRRDRRFGVWTPADDISRLDPRGCGAASNWRARCPELEPGRDFPRSALGAARFWNYPARAPSSCPTSAIGDSRLALAMTGMVKDFGCRPARHSPRHLGPRLKSFHGRTRGPRAWAYGFLWISMKRRM